MTLSHLINKYSNVISQLETEILLSEIFKCRREDLYLEEKPADKEAEGLCDEFVRRRISGEPLGYIIGSAQFMGLDFIVNKDVFIPRPETEMLVEEILSSPFTLHPSPSRSLRALDLCTGSGNIAISLAKNIQNIEIVATDISEPALDTARRNSALHGVDKKISFYKGDLFNALAFDKKNKFDIIVCNPPYIKSDDIKFLQKEVKREPRIALDGGYDGLDFYRRISSEAIDYLVEKGSLFLEIGFGQAGEARKIFESKKIYRICSIKKDLAGIERVIWISLL